MDDTKVQGSDHKRLLLASRTTPTLKVESADSVSAPDGSNDEAASLRLCLTTGQKCQRLG